MIDLHLERAHQLIQLDRHAEAETEIPRSFSICMKSDRVRRASPLARTCPAI